MLPEPARRMRALLDFTARMAICAGRSAGDGIRCAEIMKRFLISLGLVGALDFIGFDSAQAVIFQTSFPIEGTAINSTNVIGAGEWFNLV